MTVWPWLLLLCIPLAFRNLPMAIVFTVHILLMQFVKMMDLPQEMLIFAGVYATTGLISFLFFDKVAAGVLSATSLLYIVSIAGFVGDEARMRHADIWMLLCIGAGIWHGPDKGIWAHHFNSNWLERGSSASFIPVHQSRGG